MRIVFQCLLIIYTIQKKDAELALVMSYVKINLSKKNVAQVLSYWATKPSSSIEIATEENAYEKLSIL